MYWNLFYFSLILKPFMYLTTNVQNIIDEQLCETVSSWSKMSKWTKLSTNTVNNIADLIYCRWNVCTLKKTTSVGVFRTSLYRGVSFHVKLKKKKYTFNFNGYWGCQSQGLCFESKNAVWILVLITRHGMIGGLFQSVGSLSFLPRLLRHQGLYFLNVVDVCVPPSYRLLRAQTHGYRAAGDLGRTEGAQHDLIKLFADT